VVEDGIGSPPRKYRYTVSRLIPNWTKPVLPGLHQEILAIAVKVQASGCELCL
jgi:hypothetical protein